MVKEAVGEGSANLFVEEHEHKGDPGSFPGEPVGIALAVTLQQSVAFHLPEIVAKLIQAVTVGGESECRQDGGVDVFGPPATHGSAAVQQYFHKPDHAGVVDFDAGKLCRSHGDGQGQALQKRKVDVNVQTLGLEAGSRRERTSSSLAISLRTLSRLARPGSVLSS
jgi:hypothetical protein